MGRRASPYHSPVCTRLFAMPVQDNLAYHGPTFRHIVFFHFQRIRDMSAKHEHSQAVLSANTPKNRWVDILPFDHSRVKLLPASDDDEGSDYINANYMPVSLPNKCYMYSNVYVLYSLPVRC